MILSKDHIRLYHKPGYWTEGLRPEHLPWELQWKDDVYWMVHERYITEREAQARAEELRDIFDAQHTN